MLIWTDLLENAFQIVVVGSLLAEVHGSLVARRIIVACRRGRSGRLRYRGWLRLQSDIRCVFGALGQEWFRVEPHLEVVDLLVDEVQVEQDGAHDTLQLEEDADRGHVLHSVLLLITVFALLLFLFPAIARGARRTAARARLFGASTTATTAASAATSATGVIRTGAAFVFGSRVLVLVFI